jgi:hypothetical protein
MKKITGLLCFLILSTALFADMTKAELQKMYLDYLKSQGLPAKLDSDGDIEFTYSGEYFDDLTYWILVDEEDQEFFQIYIGGCYPLDTDQEKEEAPHAASYATKQSYVVKIYLTPSGDNIVASAETYVVSPQDFKSVFPKLMRELDSALSRFVSKME